MVWSEVRPSRSTKETTAAFLAAFVPVRWKQATGHHLQLSAPSTVEDALQDALYQSATSEIAGGHNCGRDFLVVHETNAALVTTRSSAT